MPVPVLWSAADPSPCAAESQPWRRSQWLAWAAAPTLLLATAGLVARWGTAWPTQQDVFLWLNQTASAWPATLWSSLTMLGDTTVLLALLSPLLVWRPQALAAALASVPAGGLYSMAAKAAFNTPRPAAVLDPTQFHIIGPALNAHSFPSGHSITAFAVAAAVLAVTVPRLQRRRSVVVLLVALLLALCVGASRLAVGAHWPMDILAGAIGGWLAGLSGAFISRRWTAWWRSPRLRMGGAAALAAAGLWLLWRPQDYPLGQPTLALAAASSLCTLLLMWRSTVQRRQQASNLAPMTM